MLTDGDMPFGLTANDDVVAEKVCGGARLPRPPGGSARCPDELWGLILSCWEAEPRGRPTFADLAEKLAEIEAIAGGRRVGSIKKKRKGKKKKVEDETLPGTCYCYTVRTEP